MRPYSCKRMDTYDPSLAAQAWQDELAGAGEVIRADRMLIEDTAAQVNTRLELKRANAGMDAPTPAAGSGDRVGEAPPGSAPDA